MTNRQHRLTTLLRPILAWIWPRLPWAHVSYLAWRPRAYVARELGLVYVPIPKVASTSILTAIARATGRPGASNPHLHEWERVTLRRARDLDGFFRFAFVRNPLDRLQSCYVQKLRDYRGPGRPPVFRRYGSRFSTAMSFDDFASALARIPDPVSEPHFRSQYLSVCRDGSPDVDFLGRLEQIDEDWERIRQNVRVGPLPKTNESRQRGGRELYTPKTAKLAAERYHEDVQLFGYRDEVAAITRCANP